MGAYLEYTFWTACSEAMVRRYPASRRERSAGYLPAGITGFWYHYRRPQAENRLAVGFFGTAPVSGVRAIAGPKTGLERPSSAGDLCDEADHGTVCTSFWPSHAVILELARAVWVASRHKHEFG